MGRPAKIHHIGKEWEGNFINAITECGVEWKNADDFTDNIELVTCKRCAKSIKKQSK